MTQFICSIVCSGITSLIMWAYKLQNEHYTRNAKVQILTKCHMQSAQISDVTKSKTLFEF